MAAAISPQMGGLWAATPRLGGLTMLFILASIGLPGMANFVAEFLILVGTYQVNILAAVLAAIGIILSAVYGLRLVHRTYQGPYETTTSSCPTSTCREGIVMAAMVAVIVWLGLFPQPVLNTADQALRNLQQRASRPRRPNRGDLRRPVVPAPTLALAGPRRQPMTLNDLLTMLPLVGAGRGRHAGHLAGLLLPQPRGGRGVHLGGPRRRLREPIRRPQCLAQAGGNPPGDGRLLAFLHRADLRRDLRGGCPLLWLSGEVLGGTGGALPAAAARHPGRVRAGRQHPLRLVLPGPRDAQRLALRDDRLRAGSAVAASRRA